MNNNARYFLGVDVGSSKTHALIADERGQCVGFGEAGCGNYQMVGYDGLREVLLKSTDGALKMSGVEKGQIAGAGFGVSGCDFPSDREPHLREIAALGLTCPLDVVNDGTLGLLAGATRGIGVNVTAGSSNNCRARNAQGVEGRIVGNGAMFGEYGGASEILARGLQMVNYAWIKRIPPTALTKIYVEAVGAKDELDLMEGLSNGNYHLFHYLVLQIAQAAREGDAAALEIFYWAGAELGMLAVAAARQIGMENDALEIVQSGSVFKAGELITAAMKATVLKHCPKAKLIRLDAPPATGAVLLGMEQAQTDGYAVRDALLQSAKDLVGEQREKNHYG
ncbi:MAG: hypothetical protein LC099_02560 [Anaerolineales bacterium]|nr:hypothetical protein [Anaerolineales bacterium]